MSLFYVFLPIVLCFGFFFNDTATTEIYTLSLHDALPISKRAQMGEFIEKEMPACQHTLFSFLEAKTMEKRAQFVRDSTRLAPNMNAWYRTNPPLQFPKDGKLVLKSTNLFIHSEGTVLETVYGMEGETVHDKEIAFVREDGRWVIDWEALVKYSKKTAHV